MSARRIGLPALALLIAVSACAGPPLPEVNSPADITGGSTVVVGRIELVPSLEKVEQYQLDKGFGGKKFKNKVILLTDPENRELYEPSARDYTGRIEATLGETFFVLAGNEPFYVIRSEIFMGFARAGAQKAVLPSGYRVEIRPGDRAVYIGTIRYYRDDFFDIRKVEVIDDYEKASAEFRKKFGKRLALKKALAGGKRTAKK